ncbi:hypothetical protein DFH06DRAFT_1237912 [Mycena polygramma]|nr:hypothetical protein DFH06DRAFT_1237912 [Mycena polygramma]
MSSTDDHEGGLSRANVALVNFFDVVCYLFDSYPAVATNFARYDGNFTDMLTSFTDLVKEDQFFIPPFQDGGEQSHSLMAEPPTPCATADVSAPAISDEINTPSRPIPAKDVEYPDNIQSTPVSPTPTLEALDLFAALTAIGNTPNDGPLHSTPISAVRNARGAPTSFPSLSTPGGDTFDISEMFPASVTPDAGTPISPSAPSPPIDTTSIDVPADRAPSDPTVPSEAPSGASVSQSTQTDGPFDASFLDIPQTVHDFILIPNMAPLIPSDAIKNSLGRIPRGVELRLPKPFTEIVLWPAMGRKLVKYLRAKPGEDLAKLKMTPELYRRLISGPIVANCSKQVTSEADVEHGMKLGQGTVVAEVMNYQDNKFGLEHKDRVYPHRGTPGSQPGQRSHAFADIVLDKDGNGGAIEIKPNRIINPQFLSKFLGLTEGDVAYLVEEHPDAGLLFAYNYPHSFGDVMPPASQPIVQIWTQLHEKIYNFGQGSSHQYSFYVIRDPKISHRLHLSLCYETRFKPRREPDIPVAYNQADPGESALYIMYSMFRIASKPEYAKEFLDEMREDLHHNLVPIHSRDVTQAGALDALPVPMGNEFRGKVGVRYDGEAVIKNWQDVLRKHVVPPVQTNPVVDASTTSNDEPEAEPDASWIENLAIMRKAKNPKADQKASTKIPAPRDSARPRKTLAAKTPALASRDLGDTQAIRSQTASGSGNQGIQTRAQSTLPQPTEASRGRAVESAPSSVRPATRSRTRGKQAGPTGKGKEVQR